MRYCLYLSMKLYIVASSLNASLNEAILIDDTMFSPVKCYRFTLNLLYYFEPLNIMNSKIKMFQYVLNQENLTPRTLSV